jgi:hypothetical protein
MSSENARHETPTETADWVANGYFGIASDDVSRRRAVRDCLVGAAEAAVLIPVLFVLRFGEIDAFGWSFTASFVVYMLLVAVALHFRPRTAYHSSVRAKGGWADKAGAWWLVGCAFGPLLGWVATTGTIPITTASWRWIYGVKVVLTVVVPVALALPLVRYVRGKSTWIALPLMICVTMLPVLTGANAARDLWIGPTHRSTTVRNGPPTFLRYTGRDLSR